MGDESNNDLNSSSESTEQNSLPPDMPPPPPAALRKTRIEIAKISDKFKDVVAKTILDVDACRNVVVGSGEKKEERLRELKQGQTGVPWKPNHPIESYRKALPCGSDWEEMSGTDRFRLCKSCNLYVYDFKDLTLSNALELVFQWESKEKPTFFRRSDGRFITADCPIGRDKILSKVGRIAAVAVAGIVLLVMLAAAAMQRPRDEVGSVPAPGLNAEAPSNLDWKKLKVSTSTSAAAKTANPSPNMVVMGDAQSIRNQMQKFLPPGAPILIVVPRGIPKGQ
jgi:hypothetical protein